MTQEQAEFIQDACDYCEIECDTRRDYSGRGMYGQKTFGVTVRSVLEVLSAVVGYMKTRDRVELRDVPQLDDLRIDNMGKNDIILY